MFDRIAGSDPGRRSRPQGEGHGWAASILVPQPTTKAAFQGGFFVVRAIAPISDQRFCTSKLSANHF
jgi:hypothetical protein